MKHLSKPSSLWEDWVHVFCADVSLFSDHVDGFFGMLSENEQTKAGRFRYPKHRDNFIISRGLLRVILGHYSGSEPEELRFYHGPHGKPMLDGEYGQGHVHFSVSHSDQLVLYAIARGQEIGVDVERIRHDFLHEPITEKYFSPREAAFIRNSPSDVRNDVFFSCWTLKEAFIKATGRGFYLPLNQFEVALDPPQLVSIQGDSEAASRWFLHSLYPGAGYAAALAVECRHLQLKYWKL